MQCPRFQAVLVRRVTLTNRSKHDKASASVKVANYRQVYLPPPSMDGHPMHRLSDCEFRDLSGVVWRRI
jgi:hypothetical protein